MGRKSSKINTTQPKRVFSSSSGSSKYTSNTPTSTTQTSPQTHNTPTTPMKSNSSLGDSLKQGVATGVGFGMANAAMSSIFSNMRGESQETQNITSPPLPPPNACESFLNLYTECLKSQNNLMDDNCEYFLANFRSCSVRNSNTQVKSI